MIRPMLAVAGDLPLDGTRWAYEVKWDGMRVLAEVRDGRVSLASRAGNDATASFPELAGLGQVAGDALLDGEVVAFDDDGKPSFDRMQERMHVRERRRALELAARVPVTYLAFDVLRLHGMDLTGDAWTQRRGVLERIGLDGPAWTTSPAFDDGMATLDASTALGLEGVVAKRRDAAYALGTRSPAWVKVVHRHTQECVVGGWRPGEGARERSIGALLVGTYDGSGRLVFCGRVGSGLGDRSLDELRRQLAPLGQPENPFYGGVPAVDALGARWVEPRLVVDVQYVRWTRDGRLRAPVFRGLRPDRTPEEARRG